MKILPMHGAGWADSNATSPDTSYKVSEADKRSGEKGRKDDTHVHLDFLQFVLILSRFYVSFIILA